MIKKPAYEEFEELLEKRTNEAAKTSELLNQKEKEFTQTIKLLELQRNLSISLSSTNDLIDGLRISLEICIQASGMDCGGIYLFDEGNGDLNLTVHQGLTEEFVKSISHFDKDSENARYVKKGKPAYTLRKDLSVSMTREERRKGSLAFATLPLLDEGDVIGCINLASQRFEEIPSPVRIVIESIVAQMGGAIGRLKARDALEESEEHLRSLMESATNFAVYRLVSDETSPYKLRVKFVSPSAKDILGISEPMKFETWFENVHPDDLDRLNQANRRAFKTQRFNEEFRAYNKKRGIWKWVHAISTGGVNEKGWNRYVNGILIDVTKRKLSEEALKSRDKELESKTHDLEELNAALKVLLKKIEEEKKELGETIISNVNQLIKPYFEKLKNGQVNEQHKTCLEIIQTNLDHIISPFARNFSSSYYRLTPQEIQIANQIKHGKTTKEIAKIMNLSPKTIEFHRRNIRKKLGLNKSKENLRTHLTFMK
ncbi:MAG: PAS domain-containing protein [Desulfobacterales bacterium]|nr:MAG: PAS domain-containing protein [Desulfobacterales bacterium]